MNKNTSPAPPNHFLLNGRPRTCSTGQSVQTLVLELGLASSSLVVEYNGQILDKNAYATTIITPDDRLELVHFVGGG